MTLKDYTKCNRSQKLYILSQICIINNVTPDTQGYVGLIVRACTAKLGVSKDQAQNYADDLASAYRADQWEGLAAAYQQEDEAPATSTPRTFEPQTPTLNDLKNLNYQSSTPIKRIEPQYCLDIELAPKTIADTLIHMAHENDFNGVGRIFLAEARHELNDKTLTTQDITTLIKQYHPRADIEQRPGNQLLIYFEGKNNVRRGHSIRPAIPPLPPIVHAERGNFDRETMGNTDKIILAEGEEPITADYNETTD